MIIGVCDDEHCCCEAIEYIANTWQSNQQTDLVLTVKSYKNASSLLTDWGKGIQFDILFLDIVMDHITGLQLALEIRQLDPYIPIVFITNHIQYAKDGYEAAAFRYLLKPVNEKQVHDCLDHAYSLIAPRHAPSVFVRKDGVDVRIDLRKIMTVTCGPHHIAYVTLADSQETYSLRIKGSFDDLLETIAAPFLLRCHKSYVVNTMYIQGLTRTEIQMMNGETIPISRAYKNDVLARLHSNSMGGLL